jgi:hypothetical protein
MVQLVEQTAKLQELLRLLSSKHSATDLLDMESIVKAKELVNSAFNEVWKETTDGSYLDMPDMDKILKFKLDGSASN